jgi:hypothetical protein
VPSLTRGRVYNLLYNCFWALPEQSLLGRSPAELAAITVSCETPPTWRARSLYLYPPGTGWPSYTLGHWVVGIATCYEMNDRRVKVRVPVGSGIFTSPHRLDRLWGPPNLLPSYPPTYSSFTRGGSGRCVKMTTRLQLVPRSRKRNLYIHSPYAFIPLMSQYRRKVSRIHLHSDVQLQVRKHILS